MLKQGFKMGLRALGTYLLFMFLCMLICSMIGEDMYWLQVLLNLALLAGMGLLMFNDGGYRGEKACTNAVTVERVLKDGKQLPKDMKDNLYHKGAALVALLVVAIPLMGLAGVNLAVEPYYTPYIMDGEPSAVDQIAQRYEGMTQEQLDAMTEEEIAALDQEIRLAQEQDEAQSGPTNWVNVIARIVNMPFVFLYRPFGQNPHGLNMIFLATALISALPAPIGYLCGPRLRKRKLIEIEKGKKRKLKKLKVHQKPKTPKNPKMEV